MVKKSTYEMLNEMSQANPLKDYLMKGIISAALISKFNIYKTYLSKLPNYEKPKAVQRTANQLELSSRKIYKAIECMES